MVTGRGLHSLFVSMFYLPKVKLAEICVFIIYKLVFQFKICLVRYKSSFGFISACGLKFYDSLRIFLYSDHRQRVSQTVCWLYI